MLKRPLCIYIDNSNIFIGGKENAKRVGEDPAAFRLDFRNFFHLVTSGVDQFDEMVWVGSGDDETEKIFNALKEKGVKLLIIPGVEGGENETVDMAVQLNMYRHTRKYRDSPGTIVLCTGDGKGYSREEGFLYDVEGFILDGWKLILYSWDAVCHHALKQFAAQRGVYIPLEKYYKAITFIQDGRKSASLEDIKNEADNLQ
jgi:hypothetical protein